MSVDNRQEGQETRLREWLRTLDSLLDVKYVPWAERYSLICNWPQADVRWPLYQNGEIGEPFDSLGWLCKDAGDSTSVPLNLDDCEAIVIERLAACDNEIRGWKSRMKDTIVNNKKVRKDRQQIALDQAEDVASSLYHMAGRVKGHTLEKIMQEVSEGVV